MDIGKKNALKGDSREININRHPFLWISVYTRHIVLLKTGGCT